MTRRRSLEVVAVGRGAALALVVGGTAAIVANLLDAVTDEGSPLAVALLLVMLAGLAAGGWAAARACHRAPLVHGAAASLVAVAVLLAVNLVRRLVGDDDVNAAYIVVWVLLALACGLAGAVAALGGPRRRPSPASPPSASPPSAGRADSRP